MATKSPLLERRTQELALTLFWGETATQSANAEPMPGIQEIVILLGIAGAVLFGPRLRRMVMEEALGARPQPTARPRSSGLPGPMRLAIVASLLLPIAAAIYFEPWEGQVHRFLYIGVAPVIVGWIAWWVRMGFKKS